MLKKSFLTLLSLFAGSLAIGEEKILEEAEIVVTATKTNRKTFELPYSVQKITREELLHRRLSRDFTQIFKEEGLNVQKTSNGQGSPYLRGFTGFRTLMMVDGIRLNNATFRDGPNQYWGTVDPLSLEAIEVVRGPASVLHGSDAIGGAVNALSINPEKDRVFSGRIYTRVSSAEHSNIERLEASGMLNDDLHYIIGLSRKEYGDIDAGGGTRDGSGRQFATGYDEKGDYDLKFVTDLSDSSRLILAHQRVFQEGAHRSHKSIFGKSWHGSTVGSDLHRVLDQKRELSYARLKLSPPSSAFEEIEITLSHHLQQEFQDRLRSNLRTELTDTRVQTWGLQGKVEQDLDLGYLSWGFDFYRDNIDSHFRDYNANGSLRSMRPRGPVADNTTYSLLGLFIQDEIDKGDWSFIPGMRYTMADIEADKVDEDPTDTTPFGRVSKRFEKVTGSFRVLHRENDDLRTYFGLSQGFRAPNASDFTRFDTARSNEIQTPTESLDPESFVVAEIGLKLDGDSGSAEAAYFYTWIDDLIMRRPTGKTVSGSQEVKAANAGEGFVEGFEIRGNYHVNPMIDLFGDFTWNRGRTDDFTSSSTDSKDEVHLSRVAPKNGALGLRYKKDDKWWIEAQGRFTRKQNRLAPRDVTDTQRIPPGGTPGYNIYTLRAFWKIREDFKLSATLDNLTDKAYRVHGSGQNEPGRNLILALETTF
jgi:hemoglobin/transferrin/lactoferrin receptor protein